MATATVRFALYEKFAEHVGLIDDDQRLEELGLESREDGRFDPNDLDTLLTFLKKHKAFHLVTQVDMGDGAFILDNRVERMKAVCLYLANGSTEPAVLVAGRG